nr:endo-polygalacturonase [Bacteroidaceae bacterium]
MHTKRIKKRILVLISCLCTALFANANRLITYPAPIGILQNTDFSVEVRTPGDKWQPLAEYLIKVDEVRGIDHSVNNSSMSYFDFSGEVEISITSNRGPINEARVRPLSYGIKPQI